MPAERSKLHRHCAKSTFRGSFFHWRPTMQEEPAVIYVAVNIGPICDLPAREGLWTTSASTRRCDQKASPIFTSLKATGHEFGSYRYNSATKRLRFWRGVAVVQRPAGAVHEARESRLAEELGKRWRFFLTYAQFQTGPQSRLLFFFRT